MPPHSPLVRGAHNLKNTLITEGVLAILAGAVMLVWPGMSLTIFAAVLGAWFAVTGVLRLVAWARTRREFRSRFTLVRGLLALVAAALLFILPAVLATLIVAAIAAVTLFLGIGALVISLVAKQLGATSWWLFLASGIIGIIASFILLANPTGAITGILWIIAAFLIAQGVAAIALGWKLRGALHRQGVS